MLKMQKFSISDDPEQRYQDSHTYRQYEISSKFHETRDYDTTFSAEYEDLRVLIQR
jgi:hypothetical protein